MLLLEPMSIFDLITGSVQGLIVLTFSLFVLASIFLLLLYLALKAQFFRVRTGIEGLIGKIGIVTKDLNPKGEVRVNGEYWQAISKAILIKNGEEVKVLGLEGMFLIVKPVEEKV